MPNHKPEAVANSFLQHAGSQGLTQLQIQKLVYIAHGWTLALTDEPLTGELPQAWDRGPVYVGLRNRVARVGANPIIEPIREHDDKPEVVAFGKDRGAILEADFTENEQSIISQVWDIYGHYSGFHLSNLTHKRGTAWHQVYSEFERNKTIPDELTKAHYKELAEGEA